MSDNTEKLMHNAVVNVSTALLPNSEKDNLKCVSFQETIEPQERETYDLPPEALEVYRRARSAKMLVIRHNLRGQHLLKVVRSGQFVPWTLSCGQWPDNLLTIDEKQGFVNLHKVHAAERMEMMVTILELKRQQDMVQYEAYITTFKTTCEKKNKEDDYDIAMRVLDRLSKAEHDRTSNAFIIKESNIPEQPTEKVWYEMTATASSRQPRFRSRSRSRSRSGSRSPVRGDRRGGSFRSRGSGFPYRGRGRSSGRYPRGGRGTRGGRGRGTPNDRFGRMDARGIYEIKDLTSDEIAMVMAIRENKN